MLNGFTGSLLVLNMRLNLLFFLHYRHFDILGKISGYISWCGSLRILEWVQGLLVVEWTTSCKLTQLLSLGRMGFRGLVVLAV